MTLMTRTPFVLTVEITETKVSGGWWGIVRVGETRVFSNAVKGDTRAEAEANLITLYGEALREALRDDA